jgi:hypothetical protein
MTPQNESMFIICTLVAVVSLLTGFVLGSLFVLFGERSKKSKHSNKYTGKI